MSLIDVRKIFTASLATSSISYIRHYNFNSSTVSDIPITLENNGDEIPITVNMTTTKPWMKIVDPSTGQSKLYPSGNVVLQTGSSAIVVLKVDLPVEIENEPAPKITEYVNFNIKSGSFPIIIPDGGVLPKNEIVVEQDIYTINVGQVVEVNITVYDADGNQAFDRNVNWRSTNMSVVQIEEPQNTEIDYNPYSPRYIRGISPGTATILVISPTDSSPISNSFEVIVRDSSDLDTTTGGNQGGGSTAGGIGRGDTGNENDFI